MAERTLLKAAREERKLKQWQVAEAIGCSTDALSLWENGAIPSSYYRNKLCGFYGLTSEELGFGPNPPTITEGQIAMLQNILGNLHLDRRQALELVKQVPALAVLVDLLAESPSSGILKPSQFLSQSTAVIKVCWQQMESGGYTMVEGLLGEYVPTLQQLLAAQSEYQEEAASLLTQAKLLQIGLATHNHDFAKRKALCLEAVEFGELSGDDLLHAEALYWHGDTFVYCYHRPQKALPIIENALSHLNSDALLSKTFLFGNLAIVYAQQGNEKLAIEWMEQARKTVPSRPELDPIYHQYGGWSDGSLGKIEGRMFLDLAEHIPSYAKSAHMIFGQAADKYTRQGGRCQVLIHQAHAALLFKDLGEYTRCLKKGWLIAKEVNSENRKAEARMILAKGGQIWRNERAYQDVEEMF